MVRYVSFSDRACFSLPPQNVSGSRIILGLPKTPASVGYQQKPVAPCAIIGLISGVIKLR
jgi:hypothetical protein